MSYNYTAVEGRLTRDLELSHVGAKGTAMTKLSIANETGFGDNKKTNFIDATAWGKTAEYLCNYARKGARVLVAGKLQQDSWKDKEGNNRSKLSINVDDVSLFDFPEKGAAQPSKNNNSNFDRFADFAGDDNEVPF